MAKNISGVNSMKTKIQQQKLRHWCNQTWPELYRYIYYRVQNREEAEDITQETYARAFTKLPSPENLPSSGYLKTVALNLIRDRWRRQKVRGIPVPLEETLLAGNNSTEDTLDQALIQEFLEQISAEYRRVLQLRIVEGYSRAETARKMGCSEDSVRGMQYRAIQALRSIMLRNMEEVDH